MIQEVTLENITKQIGKTTVLTDICLTMKCGQICGITGENGSGKTMLMRVIAGLVSPSTGKLLFDGKNSCLLYTSPSPRDSCASRMPTSA